MQLSNGNLILIISTIFVLTGLFFFYQTVICIQRLRLMIDSILDLIQKILGIGDIK